MRSRCLLLTVFVFCALCMSSCMDKSELDELDFIISIGLDAGEEKDYSVSLSYMDTSALTGESESAGRSETFESDSFAEALELSRAKSAKRPYLRQAKICVLGRELLEDGALRTNILEELSRTDGISGNTLILGCEGLARDTTTPGEELIGLFVSEFYRSNKPAAADTIKLSLSRMVGEGKGNSAALVPAVSVNGGKPELSGMFAVGGGSAILLSREESLAHLLLTGEAAGAAITAESGGISRTFRIIECKSDIKFSRSGEKVTAGLTVDLALDPLSQRITEGETDGINSAAEKARALCKDALLNIINKTLPDTPGILSRAKERYGDADSLTDVEMAEIEVRVRS